MDTKTKVLFLVLIFFTCIALAALLYKTILLEDFEVYTEEVDDVTEEE